MALRWDLLVSLLAVFGLLGVLNHQAVRVETPPLHEWIFSSDSLRGTIRVERSLQACSDRKGTSWCTKKRNKCSRSSAVYNNCQQTCGACKTEEPTPEPTSDGSTPTPSPPVATCNDARNSAWCQMKKNQGKCGRKAIYKHCLNTCDRCPTSGPSPTPPPDEATPAPEPTPSPDAPEPTPSPDDATPAPLPVPSPTGAPPAPSPPPACSDTKSGSWCLRRKSKCRKRSIYKHCLNTCDRCPTEEPVPSPAPDQGTPVPTELPAATPEPTKLPAATPEPTKPPPTPVPTSTTMTPAPTAPPAQTPEPTPAATADDPTPAPTTAATPTPTSLPPVAQAAEVER